MTSNDIIFGIIRSKHHHRPIGKRQYNRQGGAFMRKHYSLFRSLYENPGNRSERYQKLRRIMRKDFCIKFVNGSRIVGKKGRDTSYGVDLSLYESYTAIDNIDEIL